MNRRALNYLTPCNILQRNILPLKYSVLFCDRDWQPPVEICRLLLNKYVKCVYKYINTESEYRK